MTAAAPRRDSRAPQRRQYVEFFRAEPLKRIEMIKRGVRARLVKELLTDLNIPQTVGLSALKLPTATLNRKVAQDGRLTPDEGERVIGMARLVGQLQAMVEESGEPDGFDAAAWISRWLTEPLPAFAGAPPIAFMDTMEGQALVAQALAEVQSGAYA